jgi:hypothetical protein
MRLQASHASLVRADSHNHGQSVIQQLRQISVDSGVTIVAIIGSLASWLADLGSGNQ